MARTLIRNGTVIDKSQNLSELCDVLIEDGIIIKVAKKIDDHTNKVMEARGLTVIPGLVDMHVHLRDPGFTYKEDIFTGSNAAVSGGVTSVLCMPNTNPVVDNPEVIEYINKTAGTAKAKIYICGAISKGLEGKTLTNFKEYDELGVVAVSDDGHPVESNDLMREALKRGYDNNLLVISHCEDIAIINGGIIHKGDVSEKLMVRGMDRASEDNITEREIMLAKETGTRIHIAHVSTKKSVELVREGKKAGVKVTCETCPHYFAYTHEKLLSKDADYRMNPPLREQSDVDAIIEGLKDGTIDCIVTDHAPHSKKEKQDFLTAPNGVIGVETSLAAGIQFLVLPGHITMGRLIELMATNPAKVLNINGGTLQVGQPADIALVDTNVEWTVLPERLSSKSKNSAFKFERLKGRVKYTLVDGNLVYVMR